MKTGAKNLVITSYSIHYTKLYDILLAIFINISGYSQQSSIYNEVKEYYGVDPSLVNGRYFENTYFRDKGHPFFLTNEFSDGTILLNGKQYYNQKIMFV